MAGVLKVSRSRGALSGVLLVLLGVWGGLIPLVGPYVHYAYTPDHVWTFTSGRVWLEILPAAGALLGGLILLVSRLRPMALLGASLAAASGAWFAVGSALAPLWTSALPAQGVPVGGHLAMAMEQIGFFSGLGVAIVCIASVALGRLSVVSLRDASIASRTSPTDVGAPAPSAAGEPQREVSGRTGFGSMPMRRVASRSTSGSGSPAGSGGTADSGEPIGSATSRP